MSRLPRKKLLLGGRKGQVCGFRQSHLGELLREELDSPRPVKACQLDRLNETANIQVALATETPVLGELGRNTHLRFGIVKFDAKEELSWNCLDLFEGYPQICHVPDVDR